MPDSFLARLDSVPGRALRARRRWERRRLSPLAEGSEGGAAQRPQTEARPHAPRAAEQGDGGIGEPTLQRSKTKALRGPDGGNLSHIVVFTRIFKTESNLLQGFSVGEMFDRDSVE